VGFARQRQRDEQAIVPVRIRLPRGLAIDRHDAPVLLSGAFGNQLLQPGAERRQFPEKTNVSLSAPFWPGPPRSRRGAREILVQRHPGMGSERHLFGVLDQRSQVEPE